MISIKAVVFLMKPKGTSRGTSGRSYRGEGGCTSKVQKKRGLSASSRRWIERQINDPFVAEAKARGFRARSALKLEQMNAKYGLFKKGQKVLDLGSAPGGWLQVVAERIGAQCKLACIDLLDIEPIAGAFIIKGDAREADNQAKLCAYLNDKGGGKANWVISDMVADTTGHRPTDYIRTTALLEPPLDIALEVSAEGGGFLAKCFQGGAEKSTLTTLRQHFQNTRHIKSKASRSESVEIYVLATGFRGSTEAENKCD